MLDKFERFEEPSCILRYRKGQRGGAVGGVRLTSEIIFRDFETFLVALGYCETKRASRFRRLQAKCTSIMMDTLKDKLQQFEVVDKEREQFRDLNVWSVVLQMKGRRGIGKKEDPGMWSDLKLLCKVLVNHDLAEWRLKNLKIPGSKKSCYFKNEECLNLATPHVNRIVRS